MLVNKSFFKVLIIGLLVLVLIVILGIFLVHHYHFYLENIPGFYAFFGILASIIIISITNLLKKIGLKKKENYYDD